MSEWIKWNGGECPVHPETLVIIKYKDGEITNADELDWRHIYEYANVTSYRIIKEHRPTIAKNIREAAINWPVFLGDVESNILHAFGPNTFFVDGGFNDYLRGTKKEQFQARTFMLLVAEALE